MTLDSEEFYGQFEDPTAEFSRYPRSFCFDLAGELVRSAQVERGREWYKDERAVQGILLILYCWNSAAPITKSLTLSQVRQLLHDVKDWLVTVDGATLLTFSKREEKAIKSMFDKFKLEFGQTGASKALAVINPELFGIAPLPRRLS